MKKLLLLSLLLLSGCAGTSQETITKTIDEAGNIVSEVTVSVADASVKKESVVHDTLQNRDNKIAKAHEKSGMKMSWQAIQETVQYPGMPVPMVVTRYMPVIEYKEQARFDQPLPTAPSEHPVWKTVSSVANNLIDKTVLGLGILEAGKTVRSGINAAQTKYYGNYSPTTESYNQTAEPFVYGIAQ